MDRTYARPLPPAPARSGPVPAHEEPFLDAQLPFRSCTDLAVFTAFLNRIRDRADLEEMIAVGSLDAERVLGVLARYLGPRDPRLERLQAPHDLTPAQVARRRRRCRGSCAWRAGGRRRVVAVADRALPDVREPVAVVVAADGSITTPRWGSRRGR
ncbi:MAG TPA: hypothetical protein VLV81_03795 [Acidimicrobiia bacterium]|nr:hypothetical protein [Acidimicrobiia bacterium]